MTTKTIDTVIDDIYALFSSPTNDHIILDETALNDCLQSIGAAIREALTEPRSVQSEQPDLRMSMIGKAPLRTWYEYNAHNLNLDGVRGFAKAELGSFLYERDPVFLLKMLTGHVQEAIHIFLMRQAGHTVELQQEEVELDGVKGHIDLVLDGVLTDIKTTSNYGFKKFKQSTLFNDDPFGYLGQISGYAKSLNLEKVAWLAINKNTSELALLKSDMKALPDPSKLIKGIKTALASSKPPAEKCYLPKEEGTSGNMILPKECADFCPFKFFCYPNLRVFEYSTGPKYFTSVVKTPRVNEITEDSHDLGQYDGSESKDTEI